MGLTDCKSALQHLTPIYISFPSIGLLAIFSLTVYGIKKKTIGTRKFTVEYGWSYIAGWGGATVSLLASITGFFIANRTSS